MNAAPYVERRTRPCTCDECLNLDATLPLWPDGEWYAEPLEPARAVVDVVTTGGVL